MKSEGGFIFMTNELIKRYTIEDYDIVCDFVQKASGVKEVNEDIMSHSVLIKKEEDVIGMVSYEKFDTLGIIRYFIYNHQVNPDLLVSMFFELYASAKAAGIDQLISVANQPYACQLFELLGFIEVKKPSDFEASELFKDDQTRVMSIKF